MPRILRRTALAAAGALPFSLLFSRRAKASVGPLVTDRNRVLDLPEGFTYRILETVGSDMDDGYRVPGAPDGMGCFDPGDGTLVLMRNHELAIGDRATPYKTGQPPPPEAVSPDSAGGVTRLVLDPRNLTRLSSNLVLVGTIRNCAGGLSPWGWLSCEETFQDGHGYVYLCDATAKAVQPGVKIPSYGRFNHEAATVDPVTLIAYLTEDRGASCFYRFVPASRQDPFVGKLQALAVKGKPSLDTSSALSVGVPVEIEWIDVAEPDPMSDVVGERARAGGAAIIRRGEGLWFHDGSVYFSATSGGPASSGQIFRVVPSGDGGTLELVAQSSDGVALDFPDNICVSPGGGLAIAEDGGGENFIRGLDARGRVFDFARSAYSTTELAGVCFAPNGRALFVNLQQAGKTLVIEGPLDEVFGAPPAPAPQPMPAGKDTISSATTGASTTGGGGSAHAGGEGSGCSCRMSADRSPIVEGAAAAAAAAAAAVALVGRRRARRM